MWAFSLDGKRGRKYVAVHDYLGMEYPASDFRDAVDFEIKSDTLNSIFVDIFMG
jgi:hypothetical protein